MFDALGQAYDNSVVGQTVNEIGKLMPKTSLNNSPNDPNQPYTLRLSEGNTSTVLFEQNDLGYISVIDGGTFTSNTSEECYYLTQVFDKSGKLKESFSDPFKDNYIPYIYSDLPLKLRVSYCSGISDKKRSIELTVNKFGKFTLNIY